MQKIWIWNIDWAHQQFFADEVRDGRLRQGWGYDDRLDLRLIKQKNESEQPLDQEETAAWNRLGAMLDWVQKGDMVVVKNVSVWGFWTLVEVMDASHFDRNCPGAGMVISATGSASRRYWKLTSIMFMSLVACVHQ